MIYSVRKLFFLTALLPPALMLPAVPARGQGISIGEGGITIGGPVRKGKKRHHKKHTKKHHEKKPDGNIGVGVTIDVGKLLESGKSDKSKTKSRGKPKGKPKSPSVTEEIPKTPPNPTRKPATVTDDEPKTTAVDTTVATTTTGKICGPDITDNVLRVLDKIHRDWKKAGSAKKAELCRDLLNPRTALNAWDIRDLSPAIAPLNRDDYEDAFGGTKGYANYLKDEFWFEGAAAACAKPRSPCGPTVIFLGQCIHAQVVNYVQWGTVNKLCDQKGLAAAAHAAYSATAPPSTYDGQKVMSGIGDAYTTATGMGSYYTFQSADPGEIDVRRDAMKNKMKAKLVDLTADPDNANFGTRPEIACGLPCPITEAEKNELKKRNFSYTWGSGSRR